jgi:hypothetical protein
VIAQEGAALDTTVRPFKKGPFAARLRLYERRTAMDTERFAIALGRAVIGIWGELPRDIQEKLFERSVIAGRHTERNESLREELAQFLHDKHPRTAG